MESGFVKRIGDVIIQRVGATSNSPLTPPPSSTALKPSLNCSPQQSHQQEQQQFMEGNSDEDIVPEPPPPNFDPTLIPSSQLPLTDLSGSMVHPEPLQMASSSSPLEQDEEEEDELDLERQEGTPGIPEGLQDEDIVPDFPEDDLNEDNAPEDDDHLNDDDPTLNEDPTMHAVDHNELDDPDDPLAGEDDPDLEGSEDVLAGFKEGAGSSVALMESEDLLREIKPEPMEHDGREEDEEQTGEQDQEDGDEEKEGGEESSKRKQESDDDEKTSKKKKSEEESELEKEKKKNAINFRRNIREVMDENQLDESTLAAQRQEAERLRRVQDQQKYLREMQMQRQIQMQMNKQNRAQSRIMSYLQSGSGSASLVKAGQPSAPMGSQPSMSKPNTVVVKLGSNAPPQLLNKKVLEAIRGGKSSPTPSDNRTGITRLINKPHMVTPSVSIAPVKPAAMSADKKGQFAPDVVTISSSDDDEDDERPSSLATTMGESKVKEEPIDDDEDDDDCIVISEPSDVEEEEEEVDTNNSGMHTNDLFNCPDDQGRVLINVGKQEGEEEIFLAPQISRVIKPHQIGGVRFLFDNIIESAERYKTSTGFGCILAHSMGLGKTLQVVSFCDVFLRETPGRTIMCIMPINTLQNWMAEFNMWLPVDPSTSPLAAQGEVRARHFQIFVLNDLHKTIASRARVVSEWQKEGGVLLIGYEMYRQLSLRKPGRMRKGKKKNPDEDMDDVKNKPHLENMHEALVKPGPDLVICDEGHRIKNSHASISHALKQIRTKRRVVLTGYPLQNNLLEYWCMVDFVRPNYLGTKTEFSNMFERPIQNGQCIDSTPQDIRLMRYRAHVLHSLLEGFVQRRSHSVLRNSLPQKEEYVLLVRMNEFQRKLYDTFMNEVVRTKAVPNPLKAFAVCCKIWNHPDILYNFLKKRELDELQDLDLEETAALNPNQPPVPNSPRGKEGKGKKGKGSKKAPPVPIKPAATVPPTTSQPEVKNEGQNTNFPPNFDYNRDSQGNFNGPPQQQCEGYNSNSQPQGDFNNFNPNFRNEGYYQNYNNYPNYQQQGNYSGYSGGYNNYNNYYQGGNYGNNSYPAVKKEPEEFASNDKKEELKFSQQKTMTGGQVVYNSQFGTNSVEPKKEFPPFNEWNQYGQSNYSSYSWPQDQEGDQKPKNTSQEGPGNFPQAPGFSQQSNPNFPTQNFGDQPAPSGQNIQTGQNFGSNSNFVAQQPSSSSQPNTQQGYQTPGYGAPVPQGNPPSNAVMNKGNFRPEFENQSNAPGQNPESGFSQNFGSTSSGQMNANFSSNPNTQSGSNQTPSVQNFGTQSVTNMPNQSSQMCFNPNFGNSSQPNNVFGSHTFENQSNSTNTQNYQQNYGTESNVNPAEGGFQSNFGSQPDPNNSSYNTNVGTLPGNQPVPSNFPADFMPDNSVSQTPQNPSNQPPNYTNNQMSGSHGFSNFGSQGSEMQGVYANPNFGDNRVNETQNAPSETNQQQHVQDIGNQDFYQNFVKTDPSRLPSQANPEFPTNFQGSKAGSMAQPMYEGQSSQDYFNGANQQPNMFRPEQPANNQRFVPQTKKRDAHSEPSQQENIPGNVYNNENYAMGPPNTLNPVSNPSNQINDFMANTQTPNKTQPQMGQYGQSMDNYHQLSKNIQESPPTGNYSSATSGNFGMTEPNQCGNKAPFTGGKAQDTVGGYGYNQLGNKDVFDSLGAKNSNPQMMNNFGSVQKNSQDMQTMNTGYVGNPGTEVTSQDFGSRSLSNKELHDISLVGGFSSGQPVQDQSMNFSGNVCRSLQEPQMAGYNQTMAPKSSIEQQMIGYDHGQQMSKSHQDKVSGTYGAGPSVGINVPNPLGNFTPSVSSKAPHDSTMYQTSNVSPNKNSTFKAPQEPHSNSGGYGNNMSAGTGSFDHGMNPYNPAGKNIQEAPNMPNYRPMGSKTQSDGEGSYQQMVGRNQQDQSCYNSMSNMNPQDPSTYSPYGMKTDQQNNRMCDMGSQNQPDLQNMGSQCGMSKGQESKSNYGPMANKMGPESLPPGNFGPGGNSQQQQQHGFQYNQNMQTSTVNYGNQSMAPNQDFRDQSDEMFASSSPRNPMGAPNQRPPYCNPVPNQTNQGTSQMQSGTQMNQHGTQMQPGNQMNQHGSQMQAGNPVNQLGQQMQTGMNQHGSQMQSGNQMATNQMNQQGKQMGLSHMNQMSDMSYPPNMNVNVSQNNQLDQQQGAYFKNADFDNFNQPGTSFVDLKEKRGMSCQTEFDSNERAVDKDEMEGGNQGDDKKDEDKKHGETQLAIPTGKSGKEEGIPYDWAIELLKGYTPGDIHASGKMSVFFCILEESIALGDRILVFSQSLFTLNLMEDMLQKRDIPGKQEKWARNLNYFRLDGSTTAIEREKLINEFNSNPKLHLFLVSTRAGSLGINLVGANRVIVFDASWNPCHDTQAVCRVYRYGQKKPCFVYRLVTDNCLEKKIYDRQINKQGMSDRVVDECNPDAHLSIKEVTSLCWDDKADDTEVKDFTDMQDQYIDVVIQKVLQQHSKLLSKEPFQHESLLVDRKEKKLSQAEKRLAKRSYELEKQASTGSNRPLYQNNMVNSQGGMIRGSDKPMASVRPMQSELGGSNMVRENRPRGWIPASVWQRQGMSAQEMTLPLDVVIPTNAPDRSSIVLKAGQKVMVLKSPKGIYMQLENGKIIAIRTAFKPGNQAGKDAGPKKSTGTCPEPPRGRNPAAIPTNLRNNAAVSITPRGPMTSTSGPGRPFGQGNRPVRAVGPTHRPSPLSVTVTKKRPGFETGQPTTSQPRGRMGVGRSDESDGGDSLPSVSPSRPPPSPLHHDSRDSIASSSSQYGGSYSNSSRSNPVLPNFARDVSITPYSTKDGRVAAGNPQSGMMNSVPSGYREAPGGYMGGPLSRNEVSITPFSRNASMGGGSGRSHGEQDMGGREEARKEYDGGGGGQPRAQMGQIDYRTAPESRPFASVSLNPGQHGTHFRPDPLGHGDPGGSRGGEPPHLNTPESDRNKRAFQPYPSASYPLSPMDKGLTSGHMQYSPYQQNVDKGSYDSKGHVPPSAIMRPSSAHQHSSGDVGMLRGPSDIQHHHVEVPKHIPHPMYHHQPPSQHLPPHEPLDPRYRTDKPMYQPSRPDSGKQFQMSDTEQSYVSSQKPYMQS